MRVNMMWLGAWLLLGAAGINCSTDEAQGTDSQVLADQGAQIVQEAFLSGDATQVEAVLTEQSRESYQGQLAQLAPQALKDFGQALASRQLQAISGQFAEYRILVEGQSHTVALARPAAGGPWLLVRF